VHVKRMSMEDVQHQCVCVNVIRDRLFDNNEVYYHLFKV